MTKYIQQGDTFRLTANSNLLVTDTLPVGTYAVQFDSFANTHYLQQIEDYTSPGKLYGDILRRADRILNTFQQRPAATGVLLSGEKGCGKSMLAKLLSLKGRELGSPTLVINQAWHGEIFNSFIQSIEQPVIILFDEFEKTYSEEGSQESMLTLLDGVYPTKKLFVLTTNYRMAINRHMLNRPGRLFYNLEYTGLKVDFIREYCEENLNNKAEISHICNYSQVFDAFNFDMLKALVEEMNRYGEGLEDALSMLNIRADSFSGEFTVNFTVNGKKPFWHSCEDTVLHVDPVKPFVFTWASSQKAIDADEEINERFTPAHLTQIKDGAYIYEQRTSKNAIRLILTRKVFATPNYLSLAV